MLISVTGNGKYARRSGGRGHYGHVVLRLTLHDADTGLTVVNRLNGGVIPEQFVPAVEEAIDGFVREQWLEQRGYRSGVIEVIDGSWHDVDSSEAAFSVAAVMAMEDALQQLPRRSDSIEGDDFHGVREPARPLRPSPLSSTAVPEPLDED